MSFESTQAGRQVGRSGIGSIQAAVAVIAPTPKTDVSRYLVVIGFTYDQWS